MQIFKQENKQYVELYDEFYEKWNDCKNEVETLKEELYKWKNENEHIYKLNSKLELGKFDST